MPCFGDFIVQHKFSFVFRSTKDLQKNTLGKLNVLHMFFFSKTKCKSAEAIPNSAFHVKTSQSAKN